jgi:hypothetical protein
MSASVISISRDGVIIGTYDLAGIKQGLTAGSIQLQDWAWYEGMTDWAPVAEIVNQLEVAAPPAPPRPPAPPQGAMPFTLSTADAQQIEKTQKITFRDRHLFKRPEK